jgi:hypothetical protein
MAKKTTKRNRLDLTTRNLKKTRRDIVALTTRVRKLEARLVNQRVLGAQVADLTREIRFALLSPFTKLASVRRQCMALDRSVVEATRK